MFTITNVFFQLIRFDQKNHIIISPAGESKWCMKFNNESNFSFSFVVKILLQQY